jgi:hypothetical protein
MVSHIPQSQLQLFPGFVVFVHGQLQGVHRFERRLEGLKSYLLKAEGPDDQIQDSQEITVPSWP